MTTYRNTILFLVALIFLVTVSLACSSSTPTTVPAVLQGSTAISEAQATQTPANTVDPLVSTDTPVPTATPEPTATSTPAPELYLGDAVSNYGYAFTGISVQDPTTPGLLYTATAGEKLIAVQVIISNLSGDMLSVNPLSATLVDTEGFTYQTELGGVDDQIPTLDLNAGERVKGAIAFEIPDNASPASIKYAIETFGSRFLQASLIPAPDNHIAVSEPASTPANPLPGLGEVVENFGYSLSATAVENPATPGILYTPRQGYKLVAIEIILGNASGSQSLSVNPLYAYLVDDDGFVYSTELGGRENQVATGQLSIGEKVRGWVAFEIPDNATPASIKYATELFSGNYLQAGLTQ